MQAGGTEPIGFPSRSRGNLQAGETEPLRGSPREAGGNLQEGAKLHLRTPSVKLDLSVGVGVYFA
jgi:hypothetical protein